MAILTKLFLWSTIAVAASGLLAGVIWQTGFVQAPKEMPEQPRGAELAGPDVNAPPPAQAEVSAVRRDRFNEPLPRGAVARLGTVAFRHGRIIRDHDTLAFAPDGKHLISTGGRLIRRWDLATGYASVSLGVGNRDTGDVTGLASADGKIARRCVTRHNPNGSVEWQCIEYDLESGRELRRYPLGFPRGVNDAHGLPPFLSPDGKTYAELNWAGNLTLWNATDGTVTHHLRPAGGAYTALAFHPDGKSILVGDENHLLHVLDLATGKELRAFGSSNGTAVVRMAISPDGKWLATAAGKKRGNSPIWPPPISQHDRFVRVWNLQEGKDVRSLAFPEDNGVRSLLFTPDSRTLIASLQGRKSGSPAAVRSWEVATGKPGRAWTADPVIGLTLAVSPDGKRLATMNQNGIIRLWDMETGAEQHPLDASPCSVQDVCFQPDGKTIVTVGQDLAVREWDASTGRLRTPPRICGKGSYPRLVAEGKLLLTHTYNDDGVISRLYDTASGKLLFERPMWSIVSPDGGRIAAFPKAKDSPQVFDVATGRVIGILNLWKQQKSDLPRRPMFSPDGRLMIVQGENLSVLDVETGKEKTSWSLLKSDVLKKSAPKGQFSWERVESMAVSPDGMTIALGLIKDKFDELGNHGSAESCSWRRGPASSCTRSISRTNPSGKSRSARTASSWQQAGCGLSAFGMCEPG